MGNLPFSVDVKMLISAKIKYFEILQRSGETVFVPSGWFHQVWNVEDTISVNHNWFNACNIMEIWQQIYENYQKVLKEIDDCKDMDSFDEHCQIMLKASHGMNFEDLINLLEVILTNRFECLTTKCELQILHFKYNENHCRFDIKAILKVLQLAHSNLDIYEQLQMKCLRLIESIESVL